nr:MAG TPA: hypothetical protein [Caudoviricetes sp.]
MTVRKYMDKPTMQDGWFSEYPFSCCFVCNDNFKNKKIKQRSL